MKDRAPYTRVEPNGRTVSTYVYRRNNRLVSYDGPHSIQAGLGDTRAVDRDAFEEALTRAQVAANAAINELNFLTAAAELYTDEIHALHFQTATTDRGAR